MMKFPIGIQDFESLRTGGFAYVDKTDLVYKLASTGNYYFLSRPRRFGKSLLLSTLKAYFLGKRELFAGLAIERLETEWKTYPVLYIDLNTGQYERPGMLARILDARLKRLEEEYGGDATAPLAVRFENVIRAAHRKWGERAVILVDEYDKPLLATIDRPELQEEYRSELKAFYSVLKSQDAHIRFAMLTGVTKFSHVSIFSDLNNLQDISMQGGYVSVCGMTEDEIRANFDEAVERLAAANDMTKDEAYAELRRMYDGYHFRQDTVGIYNPFSVINTLNSSEFDAYWFATGTPTFLVKLLQDTRFSLPRMAEDLMSSELLNTIDFAASPVPVIYQSGYLTIKDYDRRRRCYRLGFPNDEVREGFLRSLLPAYTPYECLGASRYFNAMYDDILAGDPETLMQRLRDFFDAGDYRVAGEAELYFQNAMFVLFRLLGVWVQVEMATAHGRIDMVVAGPKAIFVFELKLDKSADDALRQIETKEYALKFGADHRALYKIGVSFSSKTRGVQEWKIVEGK